jgi:hypothetical protein
MTATKKQQEPADPAFSFDDLKILGADSKGQVYLQGRLYIDTPSLAFEDSFPPCIIITTRRAFRKALDYWLDDKATYCESVTGGFTFSGVMGSLHARKCVELLGEDQCTLCPCFYERDADLDDPDKWMPKPVRTFLISSFEDDCNMERG